MRDGPVGQPTPVTFGLRLPNSGPLAKPEAVVEAAEVAEELGYDTAWVHDHISWVPEMLTHFAAGSIEACAGQDPNLYESLNTLAVVAGRTRRIRIGVAGLVVPFRDPRMLARQALTIDALSGGRLTLAMGIGAIPNDFDVMQVPMGRRGRIANEYLAALDAALGDTMLAEFHGDTVEFSGACFFPKPSGLRRWIVGRSEAAFRRAARWGDGWLSGSRESPETFAAHRRNLYAALAEVGRLETSITCAAEVWVAVEESAEEAYKVAARSLEHIFGSLERGLRAAVVGNPEEAIKKFRAFVEAGAQHIALKILAHTMEQYLATVRRISEEVIGNLTEAIPLG